LAVFVFENFLSRQNCTYDPHLTLLVVPHRSRRNCPSSSGRGPWGASGPASDLTLLLVIVIN